MVADEDLRQGPVARTRASRSPAAGGVGQVRLPEHHPRLDRDRRGADQGHPDHRHARRRRISISPARCGRRRNSRSSTPPASPMSPPRATPSPTGKLDMVGMTRAHIADPHIVAKVMRGPRARDPPLRRRHLLPRPHLRGRRGAVHPQCRDRPRGDDAACDRQDGRRRRRRSSWSAPAPAGLEAARVAAERGHEVTVLEASGQAGGQIRLAAQNPRRTRTDRHRRLAAVRTASGSASTSATTSGPRRTTCWRWRPTS